MTFDCERVNEVKLEFNGEDDPAASLLISAQRLDEKSHSLTIDQKRVIEASDNAVPKQLLKTFRKDHCGTYLCWWYSYHDTEIFPFTLCIEWPDNRRTHPTVWTLSSLTNADCNERTFRMFADFHLEHKSRDFVDDTVETITNSVRSFRPVTNLGAIRNDELCAILTQTRQVYWFHPTNPPHPCSMYTLQLVSGWLAVYLL